MSTKEWKHKACILRCFSLHVRSHLITIFVQQTKNSVFFLKKTQIVNIGGKRILIITVFLFYLEWGFHT